MKFNQLYYVPLALSAICTLSAKAQQNITGNDSAEYTEITDCKIRYSVDKGDNWFVQFSAGIDVPLFENELSDGEAARRHVTAAYNIGVGRWFSPYVGIRLNAFYGAWHWDNVSYSKAQYTNVNLEFMWDMCNTFGGVDVMRPISVIPFVGLGGNYTWDIHSDGTNLALSSGKKRETSWTLPISAGLQFRARISRAVDFFAETRASFYGDNVNNAVSGQPIDINVQAIAGLSVTIGGMKYRTYSPCRDAAYIISINNKINAMHGELAACSAKLADAMAQLPCPESTEISEQTANTSVVLPTITFALDSSVINPDEMVNIYNVARYMKENPDVKLIIRGFADKDTGSPEYNLLLSRQRSDAVRNALVDTYSISPERLTPEGVGDSTQPYSTNSWNRAVIFIPAD